MFRRWPVPRTPPSYHRKCFFWSIQELEDDPQDGIFAPAASFNQENIIAFIAGEEGTLYEGGLFMIEIKYPQNCSGVSITFKTKIYHPNIDSTGIIDNSLDNYASDIKIL